MSEKGEKPSNEVSGKVDLRSDVVVGLDREAAKTEKNRIEKKWLILGGSLAVLLAILAVLLAMIWSGGRASENGEKSFGLLPEALDSDRRAAISGLSGRSCEEADRRPIAVMLASDPITRPVSGFAEADMVWELPVLISDVIRLMAVYQCGRPDDIGSVRSARHDYLFLAEGTDAVMAHWGGSYHALNRIAAGEFDTINALTNPFGAYFRKNHLPAPYNGFTTYDNLWDALTKLEYRTTTKFNEYDFKDDEAYDQRPAGGTLSINWPGIYRVHYEYNKETNRYERYWGGTKQLDGGGGKEAVAPSVVIVMRANNQYADGPGGYNDVDVEGEGEAVVYQGGGVIKGTWRKDVLHKNDPVHFMDERGENIKFTRGQIWVMVVEPDIDVTWELTEVSPAASPSDSVLP
ncbi:MAG: DUF3048 domain-containing protein [bacterium]